MFREVYERAIGTTRFILTTQMYQQYSLLSTGLSLFFKFHGFDSITSVVEQMYKQQTFPSPGLLQMYSISSAFQQMYTSGVMQQLYRSGSKRRLLLSWLLCVRLMGRRNRRRCRCLCGCDKVPGYRRIECSICKCHICPGVCLAIELDPSARFAACRWCSRLSCTSEASADAIRDLIASCL